VESHEYEMHHQDLRYRGIVRQDGQVQVYMQNHCIDSSKEMEFDSKKDTDTSVNLFCAGLLSGILHGICSFMKKEGNPLEDVEAKARGGGGPPPLLPRVAPRLSLLFSTRPSTLHRAVEIGAFRLGV